MAYTLLQLRQALAEEAFSGEFPIRLLTTAAGSASALTFGALAFGASGATANQYHGCWLYDTTDPPVAPFASRVLQQAGFAPATGILTVAPAFGASPGNAKEIIFCYDLHPDELHRAINRILRNLIHYAYLPVTLVTDGDLEDTAASNWAAVAGGSAAKNSNVDYIQFGRQALSVTSTGAGSGVTSNSVKARAGESLLVSVPVRVATAGSGQVVLYDVTAGADIESVTVSEDLPATVQFTANVPSGCENVAVRFLGVTGTPTMVAGPVTLLSQNRKRYSLDSGSIERTADIKDLFKIPQGQNAIVSDSFYSFSDFNPDVDFLVEEDVRAGSPMNIVLPTFPTQPYFMRVQKRFPELGVTAALINASTNTTLADRDTIVQGAMHYIERARYARIAASNPQIAAVHLGRSREYAQKFARMRQAQGYGIVAREIPQTRTTVAMS